MNRIISTTALALTFAVIGTGAAGAANAATPHTTVVKPLINKWDGVRVSPLINKWDGVVASATAVKWG